MRQKHPMPATQGVLGQWGGVGRISVDHHLGDALLARPGWRAVGSQAELAAQGGLHTGPVQHLALDGACPHRLFTQQLDAQAVALLACYMADGAEDLSGRQQEPLLERFDGVAVVPEIWPVRLRPVPAHER